MAYVGVEVIVKPRRYVAVLLLMLLWRCRGARNLLRDDEKRNRGKRHKANDSENC